MITVRAFIATSIDGFIAGPEHELDWLKAVEVPGEDYGYGQFMEQVDTLVMGRNTFDTVMAFDGPFPYPDKRCFVVTSREPGALMIPANVSFFKGEPAALIKNLRNEPHSGTIYADGGKLISNLLLHNQLDQITLSVIPVILGNGIPLFTPGTPTTALKLEKCREFPSGLVQLVYRT